MAVINALGVYGLMASWRQDSTALFWGLAALLVAADYVYFSKRGLAPKYIYPGLAFLLVFQIYVVGYTAYVSFTNYGDGHNSTKQHAIAALLQQNERRVEGSASYPVTVISRDGELGFAVVADAEVKAGTQEQPLEPVTATFAAADGAALESVEGWQVLTHQEILSHQGEIAALRVPVSKDPNDGSVRSQDARTGYVYRPTLQYDQSADAMVDTLTGTVYRADDEGRFSSDDGQKLGVGWRVGVGFANYLTAFADSRYAAPFLKVVAWTVVFACLSVLTCFLVGFFLALALNDERVKGRRVMRTLLILPYVIPGFLGALIWTGLLNRRFGFVNQVLAGGAAIPWLTDPWLAKVSILLVNLWLGFPYMFLICTGALQALPSDVLEAAKIDGASKLRTWRSVTMPLVLVSTAPLLISSFAFNFNNFNVIYMLTGGGPRFQDASVPIGHTDILISMVYSVSGLDGSARKDYGLASALSIVIFLIVGIVSAVAFRQTRKLEEVV
ncbi:MAG: ABC transporter permease subunit [Bifidobacteriaceae bacterium]|nr:ABC transporter permease subunit [Bifidobacteriaceae bacterium]